MKRERERDYREIEREIQSDGESIRPMVQEIKRGINKDAEIV